MNLDGRNDPHHERSLGGGGTALKPDDTYAVPLDHECHVLREMWKGPVFYKDEKEWNFGDAQKMTSVYEESFYPGHVDIKMQIIKYITEFLMEK